MFGSLRQRLHFGEQQELIAEGHIQEIQQLKLNGHEASKIEFKLDSQEGLTFQQEVSPLSANHKRGDLVRVHYEASRDNPGIAAVRWIENRER